jgi:hypothetical protein
VCLLSHVPHDIADLESGLQIFGEDRGRGIVQLALNEFVSANALVRHMHGTTVVQYSRRQGGESL